MRKETRVLPPKRRLLVSLALTVGLGCLILWVTDLQTLTEMFSEIRLVWIPLVVALFLLYQWLRAIRMGVLVDKQGRTSGLFRTHCMQAVANNLLPAGLGELAMVWFLKRRHGVNLKIGSTVVLLGRLADVALFVGFFGLLLALAPKLVPREVVGVMGLVFVAGCGLMAVVVLLTLASRMELIGRLVGARWQAELDVVSKYLSFIRCSGQLPWVLGLSLMMWTVMYWFMFTVFVALDAGLSAWAVLWVYILVFPISILPVKGVANLGTYEAAWALALAALGVPLERGAALAIGSHLLLFVAVGATGVVLLFPDSEPRSEP